MLPWLMVRRSNFDSNLHNLVMLIQNHENKSTLLYQMDQPSAIKIILYIYLCIYIHIHI